MKRVFIVIVATVLVTFVAAGANAAAQWSVGAKGGLNLANLYGSDVTDNKMFTAFGVGAFTMAQFSENMGVMGEVFWQRKGAKDELSDESLKLDYIEIPVTFMGIYPASDAVRLVGFAGPVFSFLTSAKIADIDVKDELTSFDFGGAVGLGALFNAGAMDVTVDGRWTFGFTSIDDTSGSSADVKNSNFSIFGGIAMPLGAGQ